MAAATILIFSEVKPEGKPVFLTLFLWQILCNNDRVIVVEVSFKMAAPPRPPSWIFQELNFDDKIVWGPSFLVAVQKTVQK